MAIEAGRRLRLSLIRALLTKKCDHSKALVIASVPRSGSTWLAQILSALPGSAVLFEPLHLKHVPDAKQAGFSWRTYVPADAEWPEGKEFLTRVFEGRIVNRWTAQEISLRSAMAARFLIIKFVRACALLPWICRNFAPRAPILLIRHPCAVVASQMRSNVVAWKTPWRGEMPGYLLHRPELQRVMERLDKREELLAARWALDYLPTLTAAGPRPWQLVSYEELLLRPKQTIERVFARWGNQVPAGVWDKVTTPSSMTYKSGIAGLEGWKQQLTSTQVRAILDTVSRFGVDLYGNAPEPDYSLLHNSRSSIAVGTGLMLIHLFFACILDGIDVAIAAISLA